MPNGYKSVLNQQGNGGVPVDSLTITTPATKTTFNVGESFNSNGLTITGSLGGIIVDVTSKCTITPPNQIFDDNDIGYHNVLINYYGATISYQIRIRKSVDIVPWATGTDQQIADMLDAYYNGDLSFDDIEGWDVGAERIVNLSAMPANNVPETHVAQSVKLVILHKGGMDLTNSNRRKTQCAFVVGMKDVLSKNGGATMEGGRIGGRPWNNSPRRTWCNNEFRDALPTKLKECFKQFKVPYLPSGGTLSYTDDYFAIHSLYEIWGNTLGYPQNEGIQFDYYKNATTAQKEKYPYVNNTQSSEKVIYWFRSDAGSNVYMRNKNGTFGSSAVTQAYGLCVYGVI